MKMIFFVLFFTGLYLPGQTITGSVTGEVTDTSGALIPHAHVVIENVATGVKTQSETNASGVYSIRFLAIGQYRITVSASGFAPQAFAPFSLEIDQTATLNPHLKAEGTKETVEVESGAAAILDTNDATLGSTFTANTIENLPLNGLDFSALTLYLPGSVNTAGTAGTTSIERSTSWTDTPNMNGNRAQANNYTLDGIDMNETFNNVIAYSPAPDALQEVKVLTANAPADYGNVNGGGVVSVLKSGTNAFHGSAYGYEQNQKFNANSWQNKNATPIVPVSPFSQAQFGGTFGGPIKRDKLFLFVDYLGSRYHKGGTAQATVLTAAMRQGDFSALLTQASPTIQLYDSQNGFAPYVGNKNIPILNPVAKFLIAHPEFYPLPNAAPTDGIAANNLQGPARNYQANNQGDIKIEYAASAKDRITGFYSMSTAYDGSSTLLQLSFPGTNLYPTKLFGSTWVHTFSPNLINSARAGFTRTTWNQGLPGDPSGQFGLTGNSKVGIPFGTQLYVGFSNQGIGGGFNSVGTPAFDGGLIDNTYSYIDNLTWQRGRHLLSMGVQAIRYQNNYPTSNNNGFLGTLGYSGAFTRNPSNSNAVGYSAADFLLDRVDTAAVTLNSINVGQRQWRTSGFVQDDYKMLPNLTINLGVRYEFDEPWIEQNNKTGNVDINTGQILYAGSIPAGAPAGSGLCANLACYQPNYRQIMPRLGFAYQQSNRLVVRGGYGATSFYEGNSSNQRLTALTPFIQAVNITAVEPTPGKAGAPRTVEQGFISSDPNALQVGGSFQIYPLNIQPAYVQEWNLTAEYALSPSLSLQAGYIGEQGQHIEDYGNLNQYKINGDPTSAPFYNKANLGVGSQVVMITESRAMMNFNALEATLRQRLKHGLEFTANYTYGRAMTNSFGNYGLNVNGYSGAFQNYYDSAADYGSSGYDVKHNVSGTGVYALPIGHGKEFFSGMNRFAEEAFGGWKVATAAVAYSGFPETMTGPGNNSNSYYGQSRPNQYRALKIVNRSVANNWFGTDPSATPCLTPGVDNGVCAFGTPAPNAFGTSRNGSVRGPGYLNVDLSAFKEFRTFREQSLGFRFDAFNAFNIVSYGNPDTNIADTSFGQIAQQDAIRSVERHLQFSAKYRF